MEGTRAANAQSSFVQVRKESFSFQLAAVWENCSNVGTILQWSQYEGCLLELCNGLPALVKKSLTESFSKCRGPELSTSENCPGCEWWLLSPAGDEKMQELFDRKSLDYSSCSSWKCCCIEVNKPKMKFPRASSWQLRRELSQKWWEVMSHERKKQSPGLALLTDKATVPGNTEKALRTEVILLLFGNP